MLSAQIDSISGRRHLLILLICVLIFLSACYLSAVNLLSSRSYDRTDFGKFYNSSLLFFSGNNIYEGWVYTSADLHQKTQSKPKLRLTNLNTPLLALIMLPFGWLSYSAALWVWTIISLFAGVLSVLLLQRVFGNRQWSSSIILITGFFAYYPTFINISAGQVELITLLLLVVGWILGRQQQDKWAGIVLGISFSIKLFVGLFLILFLLRRQWRILKWMLISVFVSALIAMLLMGKPVYWQYLHVFEQVKWYSASWNASLYGFLMRVFGSPLEKNATLFYIPDLVSYLTVFGVGIIMWGMLQVTRMQKENVKLQDWVKKYDLSFSYTIVAMLLISPLAWIYYFPSLILPLAVVAFYYKCQNENQMLLLKGMLGVVLFLSGMPENSLKPHEILSFSDIAWSSCFFYSLVLLLFLLWKTNKSIERLNSPTDKTLAQFSLMHHLAWASVALLPSAMGIYRMLKDLS